MKTLKTKFNTTVNLMYNWLMQPVVITSIITLAVLEDILMILYFALA